MSQDNPTSQIIDGSGLHIAIVAARFNQSLVDALLQRALAAIESAGTPAPQIERVPGSNELPGAVALLAQSGRFDAIIALGVVVAGATNHHNVIADSCAYALHQVSTQNRIPVINGIIVANNREEAEERTRGAIDRGHEFAIAALEMAQFKKQWTTNP
ncbi:MAG: 6,7-dimethyl-8-ribityllumazine synthase [Puniceicoccaceae bacterium MED-G30]|jgi:6,7-dimethyl-8-ribityllumazine synthase|nr:MAG: 6,7-dimethyl-8-ribityllumazine synthase [Puniceicoccaceae bacterium MED-G30]RPG86182.1 MAG: 6,7-dimethyl-8-ribityllumazine synthase [Coraliomargarita sp. TMED73]